MTIDNILNYNDDYQWLMIGDWWLMMIFVEWLMWDSPKFISHPQVIGMFMGVMFTIAKW